MLIAHISDFHIFAHERETALVRPDAVAAAEKVVADLASLTPAVDGIIFTGDLTDCGSDQDYALLMQILAPITTPIFVVPGNHDRRPAFRAAFQQRLPFEDAEFLHYDTRFGSARIIGLDTVVAGRSEGRLCKKRLAWIAEKLAVAFHGPTFIAMHHPPFSTGISSLDAAALVEGNQDLGRLIAGHDDVRILCGHIHRPVHAVWNGAFAAIGGSPAFQIGCDLTGRPEEPGLVEEPYAYFIHRYDSPGNFSIHTRYVKI